MLLVDALVALVVSGACTGLLALWLGARGPGRLLGYGSLFLFLFMAVWAGGIWVHPIGPELWGTAWLSFLVVGAVFSLMLAAFLSRMPGLPEGTAAEAAALGFGIFFYLLTFAFLAAIITHYTWLRLPE